MSGPSLVKQARHQSAQYRGSPLTEHRETSSILGACANRIIAQDAELATLRAENARLLKALAHLGFGTDLDAHLNLTGALIDMEHTPTAPPDRVCWDTLNRVVAQLQAARAALAPQEPDHG